MILNEMRANLLAHGERITELEKKTDKLEKKTDKLKKKTDKLKKKIDKLKKKNDKLKKKSAAAEEKIETIKNENKKKEACQKFLFELKDLSVLKDIAQKIKNKVRLDYRQDKIVKQYLEEFEESKKVGIGAYFDAQNCVGHRTMTASTVDDCIKVLNDYPDLPTLYDVNCSNEEAFDFLESCRGCVEDVQSYARLKLPPIQKKTQAEKDEERNKSRKESKARKAKGQSGIGRKEKGQSV